MSGVQVPDRGVELKYRTNEKDYSPRATAGCQPGESRTPERTPPRDLRWFHVTRPGTTCPPELP